MLQLYYEKVTILLRKCGWKTEIGCKRDYLRWIWRTSLSTETVSRFWHLSDIYERLEPFDKKIE
jgi:hypothetical protein